MIIPNKFKDIPQIKIHYINPQPISERIQLNSSQDVYDAFISTWDMQQIEYREELKMLVLSRGNYVLGITSLSQGIHSGSLLSTRMLLQTALLTNANSIILAHNHPSGNIQPSQQDKKVIKRVKQACSLMEIHLLDNFILTTSDYFSFAEHGLL
ncbi:MAG: JAB domain-containing protein [Bacteroidota bacterium]